MYFDVEIVGLEHEQQEDMTQFCEHCSCDVKLDSFGMPACKQCNPQFDEELTDEEGNLKEIDFRDM